LLLFTTTNNKLRIRAQTTRSRDKTGRNHELTQTRTTTGENKIEEKIRRQNKNEK